MGEKPKGGLRTTKPLRAKTPLKAKTSLQSKSVLKASKTPKKQLKPSITKLKKEAWELFSRYIRYRDSVLFEGSRLVECITCNKKFEPKKIQAGHFMSARYNATRFEEENVNAQCYRCNVLFYGEQYKYAQAIDEKYGEGTALKLSEMAKKDHRFEAEELLEIIHDAKTAIAFYEKID